MKGDKHKPAPKNGAGAGGRTRTDDLLITNQPLYQLSYASIGEAGRSLRNVELNSSVEGDAMNSYPAF